MIARSSRVAGAEVFLHWPPIEESEAQDLLRQLRCLAKQGLQLCWPVPPKSGWQMVWKERKKPGSAEASFRMAWIDERESAVMQLCFGAETSPDQLLLHHAFVQACRALYDPILNHLRP